MTEKYILAIDEDDKYCSIIFNHDGRVADAQRVPAVLS